MKKLICKPCQKSRCLVIDRQKLWRTAISIALEASWPAILVETTNFHRTIFKTCMEIKPDLVLMDIYPEKEDYAFDLACKIRGQLGCPILFMDRQIVLSRVKKVIQADLGSYYTYHCSFNSLLEGIQLALNRQVSFCPGLTPHLASSRTGSGLELHVRRQGTKLEVLTDREFEVLHHLAGGMNLQECAEQLRISRKTVDVHKTRIMAKLQVHSQHALIEVFEKSRLFDLPRCS